MRRMVLGLTAALAVVPAAHAGEVVIRNGDRLTGALVRLEKSTLEMKSEYAGELKIQWAAVERLVSSEPVHVTTLSGQILVGTVTVSADSVEITAPGVAVARMPRAELTAIRSAEEQLRFEKSQQPAPPPGLLDNWFGSADLGFSAARGNADTSTLSVALEAARTTAQDRASFYYTQLLGRESTTGVTVTTANTVRGGLRYDRLLGQRLFVFGFGDFEFDELQQIDLRSVYGGGLGLALRRTPRTQFDLFAGASFNNENFAVDPTRRSGEGLAGEEFSHKLNGRLTFSERLVFYSNLSELGEYRVTFDSSLRGRLNSWLGWHLTLSDRYVSMPATNAKKNDLLLTTGLRFTFGATREFTADTRAPDLIRRR